ncbi:MAG: DUF424 family protein [Fervidicoccaceae archaeon]
MLYVKVHESRQGKIVAVCDRELLGAELREGGVILRVSPEFYGGELLDETEALEIMYTAQILNVVGERAVSLAIREKLIHPASVISVEAVPFAMFINTMP